MSRSCWKIPFLDKSILDFSLSSKSSSSVFKTLARHSFITPNLIGLRFRVHNGKDFILVAILENMVGHKLGEFVSTRVRYEFKKKKKK